MSLLSQLVPRDPDWFATIGIAASVTIELPELAIDPRREHSEACRQLDDARELVRILLCNGGSDDAELARLEAALDEQADVWTPAMHTRSRFELFAALADVDDSIGDVAVTFTESAATPSTVLLVWQAAGRFVRAAFLDDDHLVEANGAVIRLAGATSVSFTEGRRVDRIRCYYDRLTLIEQMLTPRATALGSR